jgi:hypothetical protein
MCQLYLPVWSMIFSFDELTDISAAFSGKKALALL